MHANWSNRIGWLNRVPKHYIWQDVMCQIRCGLSNEFFLECLMVWCWRRDNNWYSGTWYASPPDLCSDYESTTQLWWHTVFSVRAYKLALCSLWVSECILATEVEFPQLHKPHVGQCTLHIKSQWLNWYIIIGCNQRATALYDANTQSSRERLSARQFTLETLARTRLLPNTHCPLACAFRVRLAPARMEIWNTKRPHRSRSFCTIWGERSGPGEMCVFRTYNAGP